MFEELRCVNLSVTTIKKFWQILEVDLGEKKLRKRSKAEFAEVKFDVIVSGKKSEKMKYRWSTLTFMRLRVFWVEE